MSRANFRLQSFRPWDPSQSQNRPPSQGPVTCRYPSPVSITATPPSLNLNSTGLKSTELDSQKPKRHPLPSRPPTEVCLEGSRLETPVLPYPESTNTETITQPQDNAYVDDLDSVRSADNFHPEADHEFLDLRWEDSEFTDFARQQSHTADSECHAQRIEQLPSIESIDPAVLNNHNAPVTEQAQTTEALEGIAAYPEGCPAEPSNPQTQASTHNLRQQKPNGEMGTGCQSKPKTAAKMRKRQRKSLSGRSSKVLDSRQSISFSKFRTQFSELSVEDRLQFMSWLFQGALSHCASTPLSVGAPSSSGYMLSQRDGTTSDSEHTSLNTEFVEMQSTFSRKGLPFSVEEDDLLVQLRDEHSLPWSEVAKRFAQKFPGRSKGSIQVHWSTSHKKRQRCFSRTSD